MIVIAYQAGKKSLFIWSVPPFSILFQSVRPGRPAGATSRSNPVGFSSRSRRAVPIHPPVNSVSRPQPTVGASATRLLARSTACAAWNRQRRSTYYSRIRIRTRTSIATRASEGLDDARVRTAYNADVDAYTYRVVRTGRMQLA